MTWEIVAGIIALIGVFGTIATWSAKMAKTIAMLDTTIKALKETIVALKDDSKDAHHRFDKKLENHEVRITRLEEHEKGNAS